MNSPIQTLWENNKIFGIDGVVFTNKIIIINYYLEDEDFYKGVPLCDTTLDNIIKYYPEPSSEILSNDTTTAFPNLNNILEIGVEIQIHPSSPIIYKKNNIYFGAGSMGNEGFVALIDEDNQFIWSIFFDLTNPIISANINNNHLYLLSDVDNKVKINLKDLTKIEILLSKNY